VDHVPGREIAGRRRLRFARVAASQQAAFLQDRGPTGVVDRSVDTPAAEQRRVGGVHDRVDFLLSDISLNELDAAHEEKPILWMEGFEASEIARSRQRGGASSTSDQTTNRAGYIATEKNGLLRWPTYLRDWTERKGLHSRAALVRLLEERFERRLLTTGPYFFPDLADTTEADEQSAIDAGQIRSNRIDYVGTRR
jgi:hypothetical protein